MSEQPSPSGAEQTRSPERAFNYTPLPGFQGRIAVGTEALDQIKPVAVTKDNLEKDVPATMRLVGHASNRERAGHWGSEKPYDAQMEEWKKTFAASVTSKKEYFTTNPQGKEYAAFFAKMNIDVSNFTDQTAQAVYDRYFGGANHASNMEAFVVDVVTAMDTDGSAADAAKNAVALKAVRWLSGMFGANSADIVAQMIDAKIKAAGDPDAFVAEVKGPVQPDSLEPRSKELLTFLAEAKATLPGSPDNPDHPETPPPTTPPEKTRAELLQEEQPLRASAKKLLELPVGGSTETQAMHAADAAFQAMEAIRAEIADLPQPPNRDQTAEDALGAKYFRLTGTTSLDDLSALANLPNDQLNIIFTRSLDSATTGTDNDFRGGNAKGSLRTADQVAYGLDADQPVSILRIKEVMASERISTPDQLRMLYLGRLLRESRRIISDANGQDRIALHRLASYAAVLRMIESPEMSKDLFPPTTPPAEQPEPPPYVDEHPEPPPPPRANQPPAEPAQPRKGLAGMWDRFRGRKPEVPGQPAHDELHPDEKYFKKHGRITMIASDRPRDGMLTTTPLADGDRPIPYEVHTGHDGHLRIRAIDRKMKAATVIGADDAIQLVDAGYGIPVEGAKAIQIGGEYYTLDAQNHLQPVTEQAQIDTLRAIQGAPPARREVQPPRPPEAVTLQPNEAWFNALPSLTSIPLGQESTGHFADGTVLQLNGQQMPYELHPDHAHGDKPQIRKLHPNAPDVTFVAANGTLHRIDAGNGGVLDNNLAFIINGNLFRLNNGVFEPVPDTDKPAIQAKMDAARRR